MRAIMSVTRPLRRQGSAADVAEAALYLADDRSAYVTGIVLPVDGGSTAGLPFKTGDLVKLAIAREAGEASEAGDRR